jgi:hypothetical protein
MYSLPPTDDPYEPCPEDIWDEIYYYPREDGKGDYICPASTLPQPELSEEELTTFSDEEW